jgi:hypothetical protein
VLPQEHPLKREAVAVWAAFEAVTSRPVAQGVMGLLDAIPESSRVRALVPTLTWPDHQTRVWARPRSLFRRPGAASGNGSGRFSASSRRRFKAATRKPSPVPWTKSTPCCRPCRMPPFP